MTPAQDNDYQSLQRTIAELQIENERLKADGARLDWLQKNMLIGSYLARYGKTFRIDINSKLYFEAAELRDTIDATMAKEVT